MKTLFKVFSVFLLASLFIVTGCKNDGDDPAPVDTDDPFEIMTTYMIENNLDVTDVISSWIVPRPATVEEVPAFLDSYYLMDLRGSDDFTAGHIDGAVNTSFGTLLDDAASATKPILIVCYTGQSAGHAVMALRLSGYPDAKVLKFGMSGWNSSTQSWNNNIGDAAAGSANWTTEPVATNGTFDYPTFTTDATDGAQILAERVDFMLANGFKGVNNADVLANPGNYFINNFWAEEDVDHYGHIAGAYRIKPLTLAGNEIEALDPSMPIVSYCWTGQTSSMLTAYLNVIGYNALSLKFGANGMIYSDLESHKYSLPSVDLPVVTE